MKTNDNDKTAAVLQLVYLVGVLAIVILQDPGLRSEAMMIVRRLKAAITDAIRDDEPAPAEVSAVIASAERILKTAPPKGES